MVTLGEWSALSGSWRRRDTWGYIVGSFRKLEVETYGEWLGHSGSWRCRDTWGMVGSFRKLEM
jgi:hypothetical protein